MLTTTTFILYGVPNKYGLPNIVMFLIISWYALLAAGIIIAIWEKITQYFNKGKDLEVVWSEEDEFRRQCYDEISKGDRHFQERNYRDAALCYSKALEYSHYSKNELHHLYGNRGTCFEAIRKYENAIDDLTKAIEIDPLDCNIFFVRGNARVSGEPGLDGAIEDYSEAVRLSEIDSELIRTYDAGAKEMGYSCATDIYTFQLQFAINEKKFDDEKLKSLDRQIEIRMKQLESAPNFYTWLGKQLQLEDDNISVEDLLNSYIDKNKLNPKSSYNLSELDDIILLKCNLLKSIIDRMKTTSIETIKHSFDKLEEKIGSDNMTESQVNEDINELQIKLNLIDIIDKVKSSHDEMWSSLKNKL